MCRNGCGRALAVAVGPHGLSCPGVFEQINHLSQVFDAVNTHPVDDRGFGCVFGGENDVRDTGVPGANRHRQGSANGPKAAVEREFTEDKEVFHAFGGDGSHSSHDSQRHGQVEAGAFLAKVGWRQIDRDRLVGIAEPGVDQRRPDPLAALAHGCVGEAHGGEVLGVAHIHVDFHVDEQRIHTVNGRAAGLEQRHRFLSRLSLGNTIASRSGASLRPSPGPDFLVLEFR